MSPMDDDRRAWERPGTHEVAPGVHRIPLPLPGDGLRAVNVYAIPTGDGLVMIDAGWALDEARRLLESGLAALGHDLGDIRAFLVTHLHRDHLSQAIVVRRLLGTRVYLGAGEKESIATFEQRPWALPVALMDTLRRNGAGSLVDEIEAAVGLQRREPSESGTPDVWLDGGEAIEVGARTLVPVATPGHTRGHLVYHDPDARLMFCGDHVLPHITPSVGFEPAPAASPLGDYLGSLHAMLALPDARLLPAHGPVAPSVHTRVRELIAHHEHRLDETEAAVRAGATTALEVADRLLWTSRGRSYADLDRFNRTLAVNETIAHLTVLTAQGRVRSVESDGVVRHTL